MPPETLVKSAGNGDASRRIDVAELVDSELRSWGRFPRVLLDKECSGSGDRRTTPRPPSPLEPASASHVRDGSRDRAASSGEQMLAAPLFAGMPSSVKDRCLFRGAGRGTFGGDPKPILIAGRDNFRDNHADNRLRVTCDVVYT